jgi:hypothetical protein
VGSLCYIRWPSLFLEFLQQWFPGFAEVESPISVNVNLDTKTLGLYRLQLCEVFR